MNRVVATWDRFWFGQNISAGGAKIFRFLFYATFFIIFLTDYYGDFFVQLSRVPPELRQPTPLDFVFGLSGFFAQNYSFFSAVRVLFLIACASAAIGFYARPAKIVAAITGIYMLNALASFGDWHHPGGLPAIALIMICLWPSDGRRADGPPSYWYFRLLQTLTIWSYFSSGLYKLTGQNIVFEWVRVNSLYNHVLIANHVPRVTDNRWALSFLANHPEFCWYLGFGAFTLELLCPLALLHRNIGIAVFLSLVLFQCANYFVMNENFVLLAVILPALFWQSHPAEQDLRGGGQVAAANAAPDAL